MFKQTLLLAAAALLFAGAAQAGAPDVQAAQERSTFSQKEAPAPEATGAAADAAGTTTANEAAQELHPDARSVYLNRADCDGN